MDKLKVLKENGKSIIELHGKKYELVEEVKEVTKQVNEDLKQEGKKEAKKSSAEISD